MVHLKMWRGKGDFKFYFPDVTLSLSLSHTQLTVIVIILPTKESCLNSNEKLAAYLPSHVIPEWRTTTEVQIQIRAFEGRNMHTKVEPKRSWSHLINHYQFLLFLKMGNSRHLFLNFCLFNTFDNRYINVLYKNSPMTVFKSRTSGIGSDHSEPQPLQCQYFLYSHYYGRFPNLQVPSSNPVTGNFIYSNYQP